MSGGTPSPGGESRASEAARAIREKYLAAASQLLRGVPEADRLDIRRELENHLAESAASGDPSASESERAVIAARELGDPRDFLQPLIADYLLQRGARTANPLTLAAGLFAQLSRGLLAGGAALIFMIGYCISAILLLMAAFKPIFPRHIGAFVYQTGSFVVGIVRDTHSAREVLGYWTVPVGLLGGAGLYSLLTVVLRRTTASAAPRA